MHYSKKDGDLFELGTKLNNSATFIAFGVAESILGQSRAACNGQEDLRLKDEKVLIQKQILYIPESDAEALSNIPEIIKNNPGRIEKNYFLEITDNNFKESEDIWNFLHEYGYIGDNFRAIKTIKKDEEQALRNELEKRFKGLEDKIISLFQSLHPGFEVRILPRNFRTIVNDLSDAEWLHYEHGALYLKEPFNLSCNRNSRGRFSGDMYYWDSFPYVLSLSDGNKIDEAKNLVRNFFYQLDHYNMVLNGNRTYYFGRSQPPLLSSMVRAIFDHQMAVNKDPDDAHAWLDESLPYLKKEYEEVWVKYGMVQAGANTNEKLFHYFDLFNKPSPEAISENGYVELCFAQPIKPGMFEDEKYRELFINIHHNRYFKRDISIDNIKFYDNKELTDAYLRINRDALIDFKHDSAERSSGTDMSEVAFENQCAYILPVCLNTLVYKLLNDLAFITSELPNRGGEHEEWAHKAAHLRRKIKKHLYDSETGLYRNKNHKTGYFTKEPFISIVYPITFNLASAAEARRIAKYIIENHLTSYGIKNVKNPGRDQWDHMWAIMNYFVNKGFRLYGSQKVTINGKTAKLSEWAKEIAIRYANHLAFMNERTGTFHEKLNAIDGGFKFAHEHYGNMDQFTWTAAVFISLMKRIKTDENNSIGLNL